MANRMEGYENVGNSAYTGNLKVQKYADNIKRDLNLKFSSSVRDIEKIIKDNVTRYPTLNDKLTCNKPAFPSDYALAHMSSMAYKDVNNHNDLIEGWILLTRASNNGKGNGYHGSAYLNVEHQLIVVAHKGSQSLKDYWNDLEGIVFSKFCPQMNSAITFTEIILNLIYTLNREEGAYLRVSFTGHSLGGWLAQVTTFTAKYLVKESESTNRFLLRNETQIGNHAHCVVFESPGCKQMLEKLKTEYVKYRYDHLSSSQISIDKLDITTYLSAPNRINCCNEHVGQLYRILFDFSDFGWLDENFKHSLSTHRMKRLLACFDPGTGKVWRDSKGKSKLHRVLNWPTIEGIIDTLSEYEIFYKWANKFNEYHIKISEPYKDGERIRYHTKNVDENGIHLNVFSETENNFVSGYCYRRFVPKHESVIFSVDTSDHRQVLKSAIEMLDSMAIKIDEKNKLCLLESNDKYSDLISYVKQLNHFFPYLNRVRQSGHDFTFDIIMAICKAESLEYLTPIAKNLLEFNVDFLNLQKFLTNENPRVLLQVENDTSVGALKIYKIFEVVIKTKTIYSEINSLFLDAKRMLQLQKHVNLASTIEQISKDFFIVIENNDDSEAAQKCLKEILAKVKNNLPIKLIIVNKKNEVNWTGTVGDHKRSCHEGIQLSDLSSDSQDKILNSKLINFQGHYVSLAQIITVNLEPKIDLLKSIISTDVLMKLGNEEEIMVGNELADLGKIKAYYIGRTLKKSEKHFRLRTLNNNQNVIFAIGNAELYDFERDGISRFSIVQHKEWDKRKHDIIRFIVLDVNDSEDQFQEICRIYHDRHVHWLTRTKYGSDFIFKHKQSRLYQNEVDGLNWDLNEFQYKEDTELLSNDEILFIDGIGDCIVTVVGSPGMGKSTFFTSLALHKKKLDPDVWVVNIKMTTVPWICFPEVKPHTNSKLVIEFLVKILNLNSELEKSLFEYCLCNEKVVLILDAFDEVSPKYDDQIFGLLDTLQTEMKVKQLWLSSRPYALNDKQSMGTDYTLQGFNYGDQRKFFDMYWKTKLSVEFDSYKSKDFSSRVLDIMTIDNNKKSMAGNPLILKVMAKYYLGEFEKYVESKDNHHEITQLERFEIHTVYKKVIEKKIRLLFSEKCSIKIEKQVVDLLLTERQETAEIKHKLLALASCNLNSLVPEQSMVINGLVRSINECKEMTGLISGVENGVPQFIHASFAEYFAALWLIEQMVETSVDDIRLANLFEGLCELLKRGSYVVYSLFRSRQQDNQGLLKKLVKFLQKNEQVFLNLSQLPAKYLNIFRFLVTLDIDNPTLYNRSHELIIEGVKVEEMDIVESCCRYESQKNNCDYASIILDKDLLVRAAGTNDSGSITSFLLNKVSSERLKDVIDARNEFGQTALHVAAQANRLEVAKVLLANGADVGLRNSKGHTSLDEAIVHRSIKVIELLLCNWVINSPLDLAVTIVNNGVEETRPIIANFIVKCFEQGLRSLTAAEEHAPSQLCAAVDSSNHSLIGKVSEIRYDLTFLLHSDSPVVNVSDVMNAVSRYKGNEKLLIALIGNVALKYPNYLSQLFCAKNYKGQTLLHMAAKLGFVSTAELMVELGADTDIRNDKFETALSVAARHGYYEFVLWLLCRDGDESIKKAVKSVDLLRRKLTLSQFLEFINEHFTGDNELLAKRYVGGDAMLHIAAQLDSVTLAEKIISKSADIDVLNKDNHTPLSLACRNGQLHMTRLLIEKGASINNALEQSPLLWAIYCKHYKIAEFLIENGADVTAEYAFATNDYNGHWTPLQFLISKCGLGSARDDWHNVLRGRISKTERAFPFRLDMTYADLIVLLIMNGANVYTTSIEDVDFVTYLENQLDQSNKGDYSDIRRLVLLFRQCNYHEQLLTTIQNCEEGIRTEFKHKIETEIPEFYNLINACKGKDIEIPVIQRRLYAVSYREKTLCKSFSDIEKSISSKVPYIFPYRSNWVTMLYEYLYFIAISIPSLTTKDADPKSCFTLYNMLRMFEDSPVYHKEYSNNKVGEFI